MKPSIVVVMLDALRADCAPRAGDSPHLFNAGLMAPRLPSFSRLVQNAACFTQAVACASYTSACTATILTGLLPPEHGVRAFSTTALRRDILTLPAILAKQGYATCAMSDRPQVLQPMGLLRDFQTRTTSDAEALAWWDSYAGLPRFLFIHLWDAHKPYGMPVVQLYGKAQVVRARWEERLSASHITLFDPIVPVDDDQERQHVYQMQCAWEDMLGYKAGLESYIEGLRIFDAGRLRDLVEHLSARSILDDCIVVTLADHGEGRDHPPSRRLCHGSTLRDDQLRIPLFVHLPHSVGQPHAALQATIPQQVSQVDVLPTILDALGLNGGQIAPHSGQNSRSLLPLLNGLPLSEQPAYAELWTLTHTPNPGDPQFHNAISPVLRHRMLRYPDRKYYLVGRPGALADEDLGGSDERFVTALFSHMLGRFATTEETETWLSRVRKAPPGDRNARLALVQRFVSGGEFRHFPKYAVFDLVHDPLEEKPRVLHEGADGWDEYARALATMVELDEHARAGEPLMTNEADEQVILKRLQDLGYVE